MAIHEGQPQNSVAKLYPRGREVWTVDFFRNSKVRVIPVILLTTISFVRLRTSFPVRCHKKPKKKKK